MLLVRIVDQKCCLDMTKLNSISIIFLCDNCGTKKSIRYRTFFEDSKLTLLELVRIVFYYFIEQKTLREVTTELKISKGTLIKINRQLQELISQYIQATYIDHQLGEITVAVDDGENENGIVDIDETLFCHLGRIQIWVFGLVDRVTKEFRAFVVQDRTADTLIPIIRENVRIGAIIYSDGWRSYSGLGGLGYDHRVVIHDQGFGQGQDTTNSIESCWSHLKRVTRQSSGIQPGNEDPWT